MKNVFLIYFFIFSLVGCLEDPEEKSTVKKLDKQPDPVEQPQVLLPSAPTTEYITIPQGLTSYNEIASRKVNCVHVDSQGKIYVGTDGGLSISSDGGSTFSTKTTTNGLRENHIVDIFTDSNGVIYVALKDHGIAYSNDNANTFISITQDDGLGHNTTNSIFEKNGTIYAGTYGGLTLITNLGESVTTYNTSNSDLPSGLVYDAYVDSNNILYVGSNGGLSISADNGVSFTNIGAAQGLNNNSIMSVFVTSSGRIILGTNDYVYYSSDNYATKGQNNELVLDTTPFTKQNVANNSVKSVFTDSNGDIYAANGSVLMSKLVNNNDGTYSGSAKYLGHNSYDVTIDSNDKIYVATSNGLYISTDQGVNYSLTTATTGLPGSEVKGIDFDSLGNIYVVSDYAGLAISNDGGTTFTTKTNTVSNRGLAVVVDRTTDKIFVGTGSGISISDDYGENFVHKTTTDGLSNNFIKCMFYKNGVLYVGTNTTTNSLAYSTDGGATFTSKDANGKRVDNIYVDDNGKIYVVGSGAGLLIADDYNSPFVALTSADGLSSNYNYSVTKGPDQKIYVGSTSKLDVMTDNGSEANPRYTFESITSTSGLDILYPSQIYFATNGDIYVPSRNGLSISTDAGISFVNKTSADGLANTEVYKIARDSQGKLYVGTKSGVSILSE